MPRLPVAAVGVTFMLAALSKVTLDLPAGTMRLEQPALLGLIALTIWHRRALHLPSLRPLLLIMVAAVVYLATLTLSSAVVATDPAASLRLVAWTALSMAGGFAAALLLAGRMDRALAWFSGVGGVVAAFALLCGVGYLLFAIGRPWIDDPGTNMPRVAAFTLEPNLFASLLGALIPLALERWRARPSVIALVTAIALLGAVGLGVTRGAYIGLGVGLMVYLGLTWLRSRTTTRLVAVIAVALVVGGAGLLMPKLLLDTRHAGLLINRTGTGQSNPPPANPNGGELQTLEYRLVRLRLGIAEWQESPVIGLGAYSFGQRHLDARLPCRPGPAAVAHVRRFGARPDCSRVRRSGGSAAGCLPRHYCTPLRRHVAHLWWRACGDDRPGQNRRQHGWRHVVQGAGRSAVARHCAHHASPPPAPIRVLYAPHDTQRERPRPGRGRH